MPIRHSRLSNRLINRLINNLGNQLPPPANEPTENTRKSDAHHGESDPDESDRSAVVTFTSRRLHAFIADGDGPRFGAICSQAISWALAVSDAATQ